MRVSHDLGHWIKMFLVAVIATAEKGKIPSGKFWNFGMKWKLKSSAWAGEQRTHKGSLGCFTASQTTNADHVQKSLRLSKRAAHQLVQSMAGAGVLVEMTGFKRNRLFCFKKYLDLF